MKIGGEVVLKNVDVHQIIKQAEEKRAQE